MKIRNKHLARSETGTLVMVLAITGAALGGTAAFADENAKAGPPETAAAKAADGQQEEGTAISANMHFTDEHGNRREPTAAEIKEAAEAFQKDLARLAGQHKGKPYERTRPDGTVSATVGASQLVFLTVQQSDDGTLRYGHSTMDEDGNVTFEPANSLPEK